MAKHQYACPACLASFMKWGPCLSHIRESVACRDFLADLFHDPDKLQERSRQAASGGQANDPPNHVETKTSASIQEGNSSTFAPSADVPQMPTEPSEASPPATATDNASSKEVPGSGAPPGLAPKAIEADREIDKAKAVKRLQRAIELGHLGSLSAAEEEGLKTRFQEIAMRGTHVQAAVVDKFLALGSGALRGVTDKAKWLARCVRFCNEESTAAPPSNQPAASQSLTSALAHHALRPDDISQECWERFWSLSPDLQARTVETVRLCLFANFPGRVSEHFLNISSNENAILFLEGQPALSLEVMPEQQSWESIDGTLYSRMVRQMAFLRKSSEEQILRDLADFKTSVRPGSAGSLLHVHTSTSEARREGTAEITSLLHAAAAIGLSRVCARFVAEGLGVNERAGRQQTTPLHLAAANGEVDTVEMLLQLRADPNALDGERTSVLHCAVTAAAESQNPKGARPTHPGLQFKVIKALMLRGAEDLPADRTIDDPWSSNAENLAKKNNLVDIQKLFRLFLKAKPLRRNQHLDAAGLEDLLKLQFETGMLVLHIFHRHMKVSKAAAPTEIRALMASDFIQERNKIQMKGNRLAKKLGLTKRAVDALVWLPPPAAEVALDTWKIEEVIPNVYEVPDHLNPHAIAPVKQEEDNSAGDADTAAPQLLRPLTDPESRMTGKVRKWDSERGFGFVVSDAKDGEDANKDIFVHRKNLVGSTPINHLDLREGSRISFRLGDQDGRPRALEAAMIDADGNILDLHYTKPPDTTFRGNPWRAPYDTVMAFHAQEKDNDSDLGDIDGDDNFSPKFHRHIRMCTDVQECAKEKKTDGDAWFRCMGLRRHGTNRRDDVMWKKEVDHRVDIFLENTATPLQKRDFDFRVKRFLLEFCVQSSVTKVSETLAMLEEYTTGKSRDDVRSWPAYLATLIRRADPKIYDNVADRDQRRDRPPHQSKDDPQQEAIHHSDFEDAMSDGSEEDAGSPGAPAQSSPATAAQSAIRSFQ